MKISAIILLILVPTATFAQNYQGMNAPDMQKVMQQMQKMQACMQKVDQEKLAALEQGSSRFDAEVKALCAAGKRAKAQAKVISFGEEMANDPTMQAMRKCSEMMVGIAPENPFLEGMVPENLVMDQDKDRSDHHICD